MFLVFVYITLSVVCHTDACHIVIFAIKMYIDFSLSGVYLKALDNKLFITFYFNRIEGHVQVFYFAHKPEADGMVKSILLKVLQISRIKLTISPDL